MRRSGALSPAVVLWGALLLVAGVLSPGDGRAGGRVYAAPEDVKPLAEGSSIPSIPVVSVRGESLDLAERVRERGALLVFYRGGW